MKCPNEPWIIPILLWSLQIKGLAIQTPSMAAVTPLCNSNQDEKSSRSHTVYYQQPCEVQHKISRNTPVVLSWHENLKAIRGNGYRFVHKGGTFPTENHHACCEKLRFVRSIYQNLPQMGQNLYHDMLIPLHDCMPSFMNFRRVLDLLEFKNQASQCFSGNQRCPGVWNSFPFLAWDLSMHPRTQICFFNQFICTGACACSSNLNYAHKMH